MRAQLPSHAALLAAASSLKHSAHADDDGPASKRAKGDGITRSKLMDFLPAPKHAMHDFGGASGLGSGVGGGGSRRPLESSDLGGRSHHLGSSLDPEFSSAGAGSTGSNQRGASAAAAPLPAGFFDPAALTGNNEMYRAVDDVEVEAHVPAGRIMDAAPDGMHHQTDGKTHHQTSTARSHDAQTLDGTAQPGLHSDLGGGDASRHGSAMYSATASAGGFEYHARSQPAQASLGGNTQQHQQGRQQQQRQQYHGGASSGGDAGGGSRGGASEEMSADAMFDEAVRLEREKAVKRGHGKQVSSLFLTVKRFQVLLEWN